MNVKTKFVETFWVEICIAGSYDDAVRICKKYCNEVGLCVTIDKTEFVYTQGAESGVKIRLVNYPRFPEEDRVIYLEAENLAKELIEGLYQRSALLITSNNTYWLTVEKKGK